MFKSILVAFDGSKRAEAALEKAAHLATLCEGELTLLTVYRHHSLLEGSMYMVNPEQPDDMEEIFRNHAMKTAEHGKQLALDQGIASVHAFVKSGSVAKTIKDFAEAHDNDLIVVGSHGAGAVETLFLGSVSHKVANISDIPVLVV